MTKDSDMICTPPRYRRTTAIVAPLFIILTACATAPAPYSPPEISPTGSSLSKLTADADTGARTGALSADDLSVIAVLGNPDPEKKAKEISVKLAGRLRKHAGNPKFKALGERLEDLKNRHQQGLLLSIDFLKELLALAKDVVKTERETPEEEDIDRGKAALTDLFEEARNGDTPVMVKRVVDDIDEIVRAVRFDGWQATHAGEREVKKALRQTLFRYKLHQDAELFEKAYGYIREYY